MKKNRGFIVRMAAFLLAFSTALAACSKTEAQAGGGGEAVAQAGGSSGGRSSGGTVLTETDFKYDMTEDGKGVKLLRYIGDKGGKLVIPGTIEGYPVVAIGDIDGARDEKYFSGFRELSEEDRKKLAASDDPLKKEQSKLVRVANSYLGTKDRKDRITAITIPDTVTFIGREAFTNCEGLQSIVLPKSLKTIDQYAFQGSGLKSVTIPDGVTIVFGAFSQCKNLTTLTLGENVEVLFGHNFSDCLELDTVNLSSSVKFLVLNTTSGKWMEQYVDSYVDTISNDDAFKNCPKLSLAARNAIKAAGYVGNF